MTSSKLEYLKKRESIIGISSSKHLSAVNLEKIGDHFVHQWKIRKNGKRKNDLDILIDENHHEAKNEKITLKNLQAMAEVFKQEQPLSLKEFMDAIERSLIIDLLFKTQGNQKEAAALLGLKYTTLNEKVKKYKIRFRKKK